jgi:hypothetical protein
MILKVAVQWPAVIVLPTLAAGAGLHPVVDQLQQCAADRLQVGILQGCRTATAKNSPVKLFRPAAAL